MKNKKFAGTLICAVISAHIASALFAAPFKPVVNISEGESFGEPNPIVKIGNKYKISGVEYTPMEDDYYDDIGIASWYGDDFHGKLTSNGELFDMNRLTAAHPTLPMPSFVEVTNLENGKKIVVRVNDRGPFTSGRTIDLSKRAAELLGYTSVGTAKVRVKILPEISKEAAMEINKVNASRNQKIDAQPDLGLQRETEESIVPAVVEEDPATLDNKRAVIASINNEVVKPIALQEPSSVKSYIPRGVFVQVGAFSDNNEKIKSEMASLSDVGVVSLHKVDLNGKDVLRLRVGPYGSIDDAIAVKNRLIGLGYSSSRVVVEQ